MVLFFFFQAEDGIRDRNVTGVQTCALPIYGAEGANHQPGADQQNQSERHLYHYKHTSGAMLFLALAQGASSFANAGAQVRARVFEDRNGAKEEAREDGDGSGEEENRAIDAD